MSGTGAGRAALAPGAATGVITLIVLLLSVAGCAATPIQEPGHGRAYDFERDSFSFVNEVLWKLPSLTFAVVDPPAPALSGYHHRCFVIARSSRQFFLHARFDPRLPPATDVIYRQLIGQVVSRDPRGDLPDARPVVIPGYVDLREFSQDKESLLKAGIGSALDSYFQRGNWRMVLPFTRRHQQRVSVQVLRMLQASRPAVVHVVRFPLITINHAVLLYDAVETPAEIRFTTYDPNNSEEPLVLTYNRATRTFAFPATNYFWGGPVNVYEVYRRGLF